MTDPLRDAAIATEGLGKHYGGVPALTDLSLTVPRGIVFGFLGPNGAGKTTTIKLLMGFIRPSSGRARVLGHDAWRDGVAARREVGFLVPSESLYPDLSGLAQLDYAARLSGRPPVLRARLLDALELGSDALRRRLGTYSKGMRQKLALTAALQHDPALLILDEPADGLDPLIQRAFEELLRERQALGRTIFMSSHDLAEVERVCERVAIVRGGRLVVEASIGELQRRHRRMARITFDGPPPAAIETVPGAALVARNGRSVEVAVDGAIGPFLRFLADQPVADLVLMPPNLEQIFMGFYEPDGASVDRGNGVDVDRTTGVSAESPASPGPAGVGRG